MEMNKKQRKVIKIGLGIIILMALIPPWKCTFSVNRLRLERPGGYGFLFFPPSPGWVANEFTGSMSKPSLWSVQLDVTRLLIQWVVVVIAVAGIFLHLKEDSGGPGNGGSSKKIREPEGEAQGPGDSYQGQRQENLKFFTKNTENRPPLKDSVKTPSPELKKLLKKRIILKELIARATKGITLH